MKALLQRIWRRLRALLGLRGREEAGVTSYENSIRYRESVFVGVSPREPGGTPNLQEAFEDAWEQAKSSTKKLRLLTIEADGENPITEFRVVMKGDTP